MNRKLYILFVLFTFQSCAPTLLLDKSEVTGIPGGSDVVVANTNLAVDSLFARIAVNFDKSKWIVRSSKEAMQISCDSKMVRGNIYIKPLVKIEKTTSGSRAIFRGTWSMAPMSQDKIDYVIATASNSPQKITWQGYKTKPGAAYQNLIILAKRIPNSKLSYTL